VTPFAAPLAQIAAWPAEHAAAAVVVPGETRERVGDAAHVFRLASISKVMAAWATLIAVEEGSLALDDPAGPPGATVRHLLSHAAGCGFESGAPVVAPPGKRRIYSNQGFDLLAAHLEQVTGIAFADYLAESVFSPLGMEHAALRGSVAAHVHANLDDVERFARELLRPTLIAADTYREMVSVQFPDLAGVLPGFGRFTPLPWGLGVEIKGAKNPHWSGALTSARTFGHFGGSGTFLWVDPARDLALVALSDREFGEWALHSWPALGDAVVAAADREAAGGV
jgi:CubicO group peptidase (beta-lactamase class C family)